MSWATFLCLLLGHKMRSVRAIRNHRGIGNPTHCARKGCAHWQPGVRWPNDSD